MNGKRWKRSATTVYNIGYHLIWCPKYRRKVLVGEVAERLKELLPQKAQGIGVEIVQMEVMPDHVHLFVTATGHHGYEKELIGFPMPSTRLTNFI